MPAGSSPRDRHNPSGLARTGETDAIPIDLRPAPQELHARRHVGGEILENRKAVLGDGIDELARRLPDTALVEAQRRVAAREKPVCHAKDAAGLFRLQAGAVAEHHRTNRPGVWGHVEPVTELHITAAEEAGALSVRRR